MNARNRRILQALLYEGIAVAVIGPALSILFDEPVPSTVTLAIIMSTVALLWNYIFNLLFERWEARQAKKGRSFARRVVHGFLFEGGLVISLVPLMAYWLETSLLNAFIADIGILAFFFVYAIAFTWAFDHLFGLPDSAKN